MILLECLPSTQKVEFQVRVQQAAIAYKLPGRVGDSPIIGAGLFVDGEVGGAVATGNDELVMKTLGTFLVVEMMRNGMSPSEACEEAVKRIAKKIPDYRKLSGRIFGTEHCRRIWFI